ncbi:MAG: hypothetical protein J0L54_08375 [Chitinophagales bacterium]|nr:hypothetical protein [Chitinophagales bacterium]
MKIQRVSILGIMLVIGSVTNAQKADTITIDASKVNTSVLIPGTHRYLVYFKMGKDSSRKMYQLWSRTIGNTNYEGKEAITVTQEWEDNDTVVHKTYSVLDKNSFATLYHESWWKRTGLYKFNFPAKEFSIDGIAATTRTDSITIKQVRAFEQATGRYFLNWHLDLEVFPLLPYKEGVSFKIHFYDPGSSAPRYETYTVAGSGTLTGYNNQKIDCWLLRHGSLPRNLETFWISKETREVLKLEQEFAGGRARYKIKLGYSN